MESENKLIFIVEKNATKAQIKEEIEKIFAAKVADVSTLITKGKKKAYVRLSAETPAIDIATQLGLL